MPGLPPTPPIPQRKRPWYLAGALIASSVFGVTGCVGGFETIRFYQAPYTIDVASWKPVSEIADAAERALFVERAQAWFDIMERQRDRVFPLGVAEFVLGGALFLFSARAMGGRKTARDMVFQILMVQTVVVLLGYVSTSDVRQTILDLEMTRREFELRRGGLPPDELAHQIATLHRHFGFVAPLQLAVRTLVTFLIALGLWLPRSRQFFDTQDAVEEG